MQANGPIADIDASGTPAYHLSDALGSARGLTDASGSVVGTADYDVFGASRAASGTTSALGFTGQQTDAETGFVFLRARYLNPSLGRFTTADTVQPNAPGTQGFNLYAYVANNPASWVDPSGHMAAAAAGVFLSEAGPACLSTGWCEEVLLPLLARVSVGGLIGIGGAAGITFILIACVLNDECRAKMVEFAEMVAANGSSTKSTPSGSPATAPNLSISVPDPTAGIYNTAKGNVADTGIAQEAQDIIDAAIERGERPPDRCEALAMLHEKYAKEKNSVKRKKVETTQKAWGCRGSRFGKGGRTPGGGGIID